MRALGTAFGVMDGGPASLCGRFTNPAGRSSHNALTRLYHNHLGTRLGQQRLTEKRNPAKDSEHPLQRVALCRS